MVTRRFRLVRSLPLRTADLADRAAQAGDQFPTASEVGFLGGENRREPPLLERQHVDPIRFGIDPRRVAYDVDEPVKRMQAAEEIIVFAIGARQERGEMTESDAFQALDAIESAKRVGILRTDAVDQNLVELAELARTRHRERQHVPEWKAEIVDQDLASCIRMPLGRIERRQQIVEFAGARIKIDFDDLLASLDPTEWHADARREVLVNYLGFPFWDVLTFPMTRTRELSELNEILIDRISPQDAHTLRGFDGIESLKGIGFGHFAAFLSRAYRENDYLLGRLHALDRL